MVVAATTKGSVGIAAVLRALLTIYILYEIKGMDSGFIRVSKATYVLDKPLIFDHLQRVQGLGHR